MSDRIFGIATKNGHIELYLLEAGINGGALLGWFRHDIIPSLVLSPKPLVVGIERGELSNAWASQFQESGHSVYVVPAHDDEADDGVGKRTTAKAICHSAVLLHARNAASC